MQIVALLLPILALAPTTLANPHFAAPEADVFDANLIQYYTLANNEQAIEKRARCPDHVVGKCNAHVHTTQSNE